MSHCRLGTPRAPLGFVALVFGEPELHTLRHTAASLLLAQGVHPRVTMELLGHSGTDVTMNIYSHVMPQQQREAADRMGQALRW